MRAEIIFDTPDQRVSITFPGFECRALPSDTTWKIGGLPLELARELQRRWNGFENNELPIS